jgi:hypothetical protein
LLKELKKLVGHAAPDARPVKPEAHTTNTPDTDHVRHSHGLEQFFSYVHGQASLRILDAGGVTQANVGFITGMGHKLHTEDFLRVLDSGDAVGPEEFLKQNLDYAPGSLDGALLWDVLEFLPEPLLSATISRLHRVTKPGSYLLAFFHADEKAVSVPVYSYRISDASTLQLASPQMRRPVQRFNNRGVEKLFHTFQSVKFFLTRDHLREVIVRR